MRGKLLGLLVKLAMKRRWVIYVSSAILTAVSFYFASSLNMDMRWLELLPESMPIAKEFKQIDNKFINPSNMIVAISGEDKVILEKITDEVTDLLEKELVCSPGMSLDEIKESGKYAKYVYGKLPENWMLKNSLKIIKPNDARRSYDIFKDTSILEYLRHLNDDFESEYTDSENVKNQERQIVSTLEGVENFVDVLSLSAGGSEVSYDTIERSARDLTIGRPYLFSLDNKMSLVMVASAVPSDDAQTMVQMDYRIEKILKPLADKYPDYKIERTGMTAIARDEMDSVGPYTMMLSLAALVIIFVILAVNFRNISTPLLNLVPIICGIIWSMGLIKVTIGTLNIITSMMMIVLLGLGIDFTIHLSSRFHEELSRKSSVEEALRKTIGGTGRGVITGALTTAVAFLALMIADTKAIWQFGFCAGTGVLLTLLASMWILPALLASKASDDIPISEYLLISLLIPVAFPFMLYHIILKITKKPPAIAIVLLVIVFPVLIPYLLVWSVKKSKQIPLKPKPMKDFNALAAVSSFMNNHSKSVIAIFAVLFIAGFLAATQLKWEYNFMNLEPENLRSIELQDEIVDKYKLSVTTSMLTTGSIEESRNIRKELKSKRVVGEVSDISQYVSRDDFNESLPYLVDLQKENSYPQFPTDFNIERNRMEFADEVDRLWANLVEIQALSFTGGQDRVVEKLNNIIATREDRDSGKLRILSDKFFNDDVNWESFSSFSDKFTGSLSKRVKVMTMNMDEVKESDIPEKILAQFKSPVSDRYLVTIMPKKNLYTKEELESFSDVVSGISKNVTGNPQLILAMNTATMSEGRTALLAATIVIIILLIIDFRNPFISLLTFLPLIGSLLLTTGMMFIFKEKLNYVNMIALPVILGIGIDDGVHLMHRYIEEGKGSLKSAVNSVGRAMLMTSLTTMTGFGCLMFYLMRGMASLGFVLFFGVGFCFIITVMLLPALLKKFDKYIFKGGKIK